MTNGNEEQMNDKVSLEIARELAIKGQYDEAIELLSPLIRSPFSIEALNLLGKIYAQKQDFGNAEKYFKATLKQDENNAEAKAGLKKCGELKGSRLKTYFNFNRLKVYSLLLVALVLVVGAAAIFSLGNTAPGGNTISFEETTLADADIINMDIKVKDSKSVLEELEYLKSDGYSIDMDHKGKSINISTDPSSIYEVLYVLDYVNSNENPVNVDSITFTLSEDVKNKTASEANENIVKNINITGIKEINNKSAVVIPNTASFENVSDYSAQQHDIFNMLYDYDYSKVKVKTAVEIKS